MGISAAWIALKGVDKAEALERLEAVETGEIAEPFDFECSMAELPNGWLVILAPDFDYASADRMASLSAGGTAIACAIEEHVMYSLARGYEDGRAVWSIDHDGGQKGAAHLALTGPVPVAFGPIRERLLAEQAEEDAGENMTDHVFTAPVDLVYALCGFRADGSPMPEGEPEMIVLKSLRPAARPPARASGGGGLLKALAGIFRGR